MSNFHERLVELRKSKKKTQKETADYLGVHVRTVQFYESGKKLPGFDVITKLADFLGVSVDFLMGKTIDPATEIGVKPEQAEFLRWVEENVSDVFFYEFDKSPDAAKAQLMKDLRYMWERDKMEQNHKNGD